MHAPQATMDLWMGGGRPRRRETTPRPVQITTRHLTGARHLAPLAERTDWRTGCVQAAKGDECGNTVERRGVRRPGQAESEAGCGQRTGREATVEGQRGVDCTARGRRRSQHVRPVVCC